MTEDATIFHNEQNLTNDIIGVRGVPLQQQPK